MVIRGQFAEIRVKMKKLVWQVAMAVEPGEDGMLRFAFHAPCPSLIKDVFDRLRGTLFEDYQITEEVMGQIINGKCYRAWVAEVRGADTHKLSVTEWPMVIKGMMERRFRCRVTYFENYDKFLNA